MNKYIFAIIVLLNFNLNAQITTTIFPNGNAFKEFHFLNQVSKEAIPLYTMPYFNLDSIIQEENYNYINNFSYISEKKIAKLT